MEKSANTPRFAPEEEIAKYVRLMKHVMGNYVFYVGVCPFHPNQTTGIPQTLYVDSRKQGFRCLHRGCIAYRSNYDPLWGVEKFLKLVEEYNLQPVLQNQQTFQLIVQSQEVSEKKEPSSDKDIDTEKNDIEKNYQLSLFDEGKDFFRGVSYSMLENYQLCPFKFKHIYIDRESVELVSDSRRIGTSVHSTLKEFYSLPMQERTHERLSNIFRRNWSVLLSDNSSLFIEYYSMIVSLVETENIHSFPVKLEASFNFLKDNIVLFGRIDRIDRFQEGVYEVVDYKILKSGPNDENEAKGSLQSVLHYFGAHDIIGEFPTILTYLRIEDGRRVSFSPSHNEMERKFQKIKIMVEKIRGNKGFTATKNQYCSACKLFGNCPATR